MDVIIEYAPLLWRGLLVTLQVTLLGIALTVLVAFVAGLSGLSKFWFIRWPSFIFVEFFRGSGLIVQMFWLFFALPLFGIQLSPLTAGVLALGLNMGAYGSEIVRGTVASRPKGQTEAAIALGMSPTKRFWRILIPQSIPAMLPPFGNLTVDLLKNTSLVSLVTVADLTWGAQTVRTNTGQTVEIFFTIMVLYYFLSLLLGQLTSFLERRFALDRKSVGSVRNKSLFGVLAK